MTVTLPADTYYRLRYLQARAEADAARAEAIALRAAAEAGRTLQAFTAALEAAGRDHGFDPTTSYTWHDDTTSLVPPPQAPSAPTR